MSDRPDAGCDVAHDDPNIFGSTVHDRGASFAMALDTAWTAVAMALGVSLLAFGYSRSRSASSGALACYVVGEVLIAGTPVLFILRPRKWRREQSLWLTFAIGLSSFAACWTYSPTRLRFEDEFQHARTAQSILVTHHLFGPNTSLAVSPRFPGLEIVTTALANLGHLSVFASGTIVSGICHVAMVMLCAMVALELGGSPRAAAIAAVIFASGFDFQFFLSYFAYQTFAMPFMIATLLMVVKMAKANSARAAVLFGIAGACFGAVTVMSHHVTSYALIGFLVVMVVVSALRGEAKLRNRLGGLGLILAVFTGVWTGIVAPRTFSYLKQIKVFLLGVSPPAVAKYSTASATVRLATSKGLPVGVPATPLVLRALSDLGALFIVGALVFLVAARPRGTRVLGDALLTSFVIGGLGYLAFALVALAAPGADQLVARGEALILIPAGVVVGIVLDAVTPSTVRTLGGSLVMRSHSVGLGVAIGIIAVGGTLAGWPSIIAKLPAPYQVAGFESSTDQRTVAVGTWALHALPPQAIFAATLRESLIVQAISGLSPTQYPAGLFESERFRPIDAMLVQHAGITYVIADERITKQLPEEGSYFAHDPLQGHLAKPLPPQVLTKFASIPGVDRIYDDGVIVVYRLTNSPYWHPTSTK